MVVTTAWLTLVFSVSCTGPCPQNGDKFTPAAGQPQGYIHVSGLHFVDYDCGDVNRRRPIGDDVLVWCEDAWCSEGYRGDYCASRASVEAWAEAACPRCRLECDSITYQAYGSRERYDNTYDWERCYLTCATDEGDEEPSPGSFRFVW